MICLSLAAEGRPPTTYVFDQSEIVLGRSSACEVVLDSLQDPAVSRMHARIRRASDGSWRLRDLESTHGTFLNDFAVRGEVRLATRDLIRLGTGGPAVRVSFEQQQQSNEESMCLVRQPIAGQFPLALYRDLPKRFHVFQKVGEGGYGQVWKARLRDGGGWKAIKFLRPELLEPGGDATGARVALERLVRRFQLEAELMQRLVADGARGVVPVEEVGTDLAEGFVYMIMDYVEGESLDQMLARHHTLGQQEICRCLMDVAETLDRAHSMAWVDDNGREMKGIVHRDIKPSNIIIRQVDGRAVLCDFGIAGIEKGAERLTAPQLRVSSFKYTPPEALTQNHITPAIDLWGLAVTAYVVLSQGTFPYGGMSLTETLRAIRNNRYVPVTKYRPDLDPALAELLRWALDADPRLRPQTAREWMERLQPLS